MKRDLQFTWCSQHGKRRFHSRKDARKAIRLWSRGHGMREYRCSLAAGCWHVGHLPPAVRYGDKTAREVYGHARQQDHHRDHRRGDGRDHRGAVPAGRPAVSVPIPGRVRIHFANPEADPSTFERCLAEYVAGWLIITDLTKDGMRKRHGFPAHTVDYVDEESE